MVSWTEWSSRLILKVNVVWCSFAELLYACMVEQTWARVAELNWIRDVVMYTAIVTSTGKYYWMGRISLNQWRSQEFKCGWAETTKTSREGDLAKPSPQISLGLGSVS